jgi:NPCBM/NEW2 domain-containing protein
MADEVDSSKSRWPDGLTVFSLLANCAQLAGLVLAPGREWLAVFGVLAFVTGLVAALIAWRQLRWLLAVGAALLLFLGLGLLGYARFVDHRNDAVASPPPVGEGDSSVPATPTASASSQIRESNPDAGSPSTTPLGTPENTQNWYELTAYRAVAWGNGHTSVDSIMIGTTSYPSSIRGSYSSSTSDPNNFRTWLVGGRCSKLSVWVGKDQASPKTAGTGRFIVKSGERQIRAAAATFTDPPEHLQVDLTGVSRLTLLDTRKSRDADNAWGSPQVFCSEPPGAAR